MRLLPRRSRTETARVAGGPAVRVVAVGGWLTASAFAVAGLFLGQNGMSFVPSYAVALLFPTLGTLIIWQRPSNPIGWIFGVAGLAGSMSLFASQYAYYGSMLTRDPLVGVTAAGWLGAWLWVPAVGLVGTVFVLFPDGRLPSGRWWPVLGMIVAGLVAVASGMAIRPWQASIAGLYDGSLIGVAVRATPFESPAYPGDNPFALGASLVLSDRLLGVGASLMLIWVGSEPSPHSSSATSAGATPTASS